MKTFFEFLCPMCMIWTATQTLPTECPNCLCHLAGDEVEIYLFYQGERLAMRANPNHIDQPMLQAVQSAAAYIGRNK